MIKFAVPVEVTISGLISVEANDPEEAIILAKQEYDRRRQAINNAHYKLVDSPDAFVDFAEGDDPSAVELDEDEG